MEQLLFFVDNAKQTKENVRKTIATINLQAKKCLLFFMNGRDSAHVGADIQIRLNEYGNEKKQEAKHMKIPSTTNLFISFFETSSHRFP